MLQSLVAVAWADQALHAREVEVIDALLAAFGVSEAEAAIVRAYAQTPRTLDDVPLSELSSGDRRLLVSHAVLLSYADGDPSPSELHMIDELLARLRISEDEAVPLLAAAHARARRLAATQAVTTASAETLREQTQPLDPSKPEQDA
ncbi:MAG: hypothetical protein JWN48_4406 [Myxococcaceae bacterium]|nr:hypothetical protein [Myxococcaceae bacterium]